MDRRVWGSCAAVLLLSACASGVAVVTQAHVEATARRHCEQMPSMDQRNQCLQAFDTTAPKDLRPRAPMRLSPSPTESSAEQERQRSDALCIRREGQAPLCPN